MNGETYQICNLIVAAKNALKSKTLTLDYTAIPYENTITFKFLSKKMLFHSKPFITHDVNEWFKQCHKNKIKDFKLLTPVNINDRNILGFSNTSQNILVCYHENYTTYFSTQWDFDTFKQGWNIVYTEHEWPNVPSLPPIFEDTTPAFIDILSTIKDFSQTLNFPYFTDIFQQSLMTLQGSHEFSNTYNYPLLKLPPKNSSIFIATAIADVFGAMGSWNDSPPYVAHELHLDKEYEEYSSELLKQLRLALLYAINEW